VRLAFAVTLLVGCASGAERGRDTEPVSEQASEHSPQAMALYESILAIYAEEALEVEVASKAMLLVGSPFVEIEQGVRRRVISRVLTFGRNVALNVVVEYQSLSDEDGPWETVADGSDWAQKAASEELQLARAVERHFHRHQRRRR
jgi:hypothetical protein